MSEFVIEMHGSYLTVSFNNWAWGHVSDAIKFTDVRSALRVRDIIEAQPRWAGKCSIKEIANKRPLDKSDE